MSAEQSTSEHGWAALHVLLGLLGGVRVPGEGTGCFSFTPDVQEQILVRKNHADYPATVDRASFFHDDLIIVYRDSPAKVPRAIYFDNEGHVIHYTVEVLEGGKTIQFLSEISPSRPGYRLTYTLTNKDSLTLTFEIAPPGMPPTYSTYIEARAARAEQLEHRSKIHREGASPKNQVPEKCT